MVAISTQHAQTLKAHRGRKAAEYSSPEQIVPCVNYMNMLFEDGIITKVLEEIIVKKRTASLDSVQ